MSTQDHDQEAVRAIRARAQALSGQAELGHHMADAEVLAALIDGTLSLDDIDDETLERCRNTFGAEHVITTLLQESHRKGVADSVPRPALAPQGATAADSFSAPVVPFPARPAQSWWRQHAHWVAVAASLACVSTLFMWIGRNVPQPVLEPVNPMPVDGAKVALQWPSRPPFDPGTVQPWGPSTPSLPKGWPDFTKGTATLGAGGGNAYTPWRLATVIIRTEGAMGSGAFIAPDGWLLTNYHVVEVAAQAAAMTGAVPTVDVILGRTVEGRIKPRPAVKARVYRVDPVHDLAVLKLESLPDGMREVPFFTFAKEVREGEDCFVIGSQANGPAWWVRSGNVSVLFDYPNELSQVAAWATTSEHTVERTRATVAVTDTRISGGDSGGPLLNRKGELIGLTFATPGNRTSGSVGWHIALEHLRSIVAQWPSQPEGVPFDPWTAGLPSAQLGTPGQADGDRDGRIDTVIFPYTATVTTEAGQTETQPVAFTLFIDVSQRIKAKEGPSDLTPAGLWSSEDRGNFRHDVFITIRADDRVVVGYTNAQGIVDDVRIGSAQQETLTVAWRRTPQGTWHAGPPSRKTEMLDPTKINDINLTKIKDIVENLLGVEGEPASPRPNVAPRPHTGMRRSSEPD